MLGRSLNNVKIRQKGAQKGHSLLKRKSDALTARFRAILARIHEAKIAMGQLMKSGAFALAELNFATTSDVGYLVRETVTGPAQLKLRTRMENVSGVMLPVFEAHREEQAGGAKSAFELTCLSRGGQQVQKCKETFSRALDALIQLASLQVGPRRQPAPHPCRRPFSCWTT